jgi:hypothetical protein
LGHKQRTLGVAVVLLIPAFDNYWVIYTLRANYWVIPLDLIFVIITTPENSFNKINVKIT